MPDYINVILGGIVLAIFGGGGALWLRKKNSSDAVSRAKDAAESSVFDNALAAERLDKDRWRATAEEAWKKIEELQAKDAINISRINLLVLHVKQMRRLVKKAPEELQQYMPSDFIGLDENK